MTELNRQSLGGDVEVIYLGDNKAMSVGEKRNMLLYLSSGDYVTFVDDDDEVKPDYVKKILNGIQSEPDVFCYNVLKKVTNQNGTTRTQLMKHAKAHGKNHSEKGVMYMIPNHLSVIKREIAIREQFPHINLSEDHKWADKIILHLDREVRTEDVLYIYNDNKALSETRRR